MNATSLPGPNPPAEGAADSLTEPRENPTGPSPELYFRDLECVRAALAGDADARARLETRLECVERIVKHRNRQLGGRVEAGDLADLVQDVLVVVWRKLPSFAGRSSIETWVYGVCHFEILSWVRGEAQRQDAHAQALGGEALEQVSDPSRGAEAALPIHLEHEGLFLGLSRLEPEEEAILRRRHYDDLSFEEIGRLLGLSTSGAKHRYYLALRRLRQVMPDSGLSRNPNPSPRSEPSS